MEYTEPSLHSLAPAAYGIPWVPEIPSQWQQGTEPGVTAVTTVFGNTAWPAPSSDPGGPQPPQARPPAPANTARPAPRSDPRGPQPPQARPAPPPQTPLAAPHPPAP